MFFIWGYRLKNIPKYWQVHLQEKINLIKRLKSNAGENVACFAVITDLHWSFNAKKSPLLLEKVMNECDIPYFINCGDTVSGFSFCEKNELLGEMQEVATAFKSIEKKCLMIEGNHDRAYSPPNTNVPFSMNISKKEFVENAFLSLPEYLRKKDELYYYIDDEKSNTRYVVLDTHDIPCKEDCVPKYNAFLSYYMRQEQFEWLINQALILPNEDWQIVLLSHENSTVFNSNHLTKSHEGLVGVIKAFNKREQFFYNQFFEENSHFNLDFTADFRNAHGRILLWVSGHEHGDKEIKCDAITSISVMNDSVIKTNPERLGTENEQAFDVFIIDKNQNKCFAVRIGFGENREFDLCFK